MAWRFPIWYFLSVVLGKLMCISALGPSSSPSNSFVILLIHSAFLCSLSCHILLQNCSVSLVSGGWYVLVSSPSVVYWPSTPPNMPFQRRQKCILYWRGRVWLTIWDRVKIQRYSHRLMHRKRVTCELHDCCFRLMTIKHDIPKIEWAMELLYNSVRQEVSLFGDQKLEIRWVRDKMR